MNDDAEYRSLWLIADRSNLIRPHQFTVDGNSTHELIQRPARRIAIQQDFVLFFELVARVSNTVRQFTIISQKQKTRRRPIEPANWYDAFFYIHQVENGPATAFILRSRDIAGRLVQ
jgi:hypothetical protein